ncbi:hypothetical protein Tco_0038955 [Tanacetum coccineum]
MNSFRPPFIEDWNSDDESEVEIIPKDKTVSSSTEKIKLVKSAREIVEKVETSKQNKHYSRGNQRNWNNLMPQRLGSDFKMINKACFVCGSFEHLHYVCDKKKICSGKINTAGASVNTAGVSVNTAVRSVNIAGSKPTVNHPRSISNGRKEKTKKKGCEKEESSYVRVEEKEGTMQVRWGRVEGHRGEWGDIFNKKVNTVRLKDTTARDRAVVSENKRKGFNAVKASACWGNPQQKEYKEK